jgi:acyl-CoA synthetase (AMP-forming)/AMP-acid ligase II
MTTNVSFALLDAAVIAGRGEEPVVDRMTHARLLEEVAALGGVLHHLGVETAVPVVIELESGLDAVIAALATARLGGVVCTVDQVAAPVVIVSAGSELTADGRLRLVRGDNVQEPDLEWDVMIRAGRTDPAACTVLEPDSPYSPERSVAEEIAVLGGSSAPYDVDELRVLLQV